MALDTSAPSNAGLEHMMSVASAATCTGACRHLSPDRCLFRDVWKSLLSNVWTGCYVDLPLFLQRAEQYMKKYSIKPEDFFDNRVISPEAQAGTSPELNQKVRALRKYDRKMTQILETQASTAAEELEKHVEAVDRLVHHILVPACERIAQEKSDDEELERVRSELATAYRSLASAVDFCVMNRACVHHLATDHLSQIQAAFASILLRKYPMSTQPARRVMQQCRSAYLVAFSDSDPGMSDLVSFAYKAGEPLGYEGGFIGGVSLGIGLMCVVAGMMVWPLVLHTMSVDHRIYFVRVVPIYRLAAAVSVLQWCSCFVLWAVSALGINYPLILGTPPLRAARYSRRAAIYTCVVGVCFMLSTILGIQQLGHGYIPLWLPPLCAFAATVVALLPLKFNMSPYRRWALRALGDVAATPLRAVTFSANLMGDILTSIVRPMVDAVDASCLVTTGGIFHVDGTSRDAVAEETPHQRAHEPPALLSSVPGHAHLRVARLPPSAGRLASSLAVDLGGHTAVSEALSKRYPQWHAARSAAPPPAVSPPSPVLPYSETCGDCASPSLSRLVAAVPSFSVADVPLFLSPSSSSVFSIPSLSPSATASLHDHLSAKLTYAPVPSDSAVSYTHAIFWPPCHHFLAFVTPFILLAPYVMRLLQCLRRIADTGEVRIHLANAFKYALSLAVSLFSWLHSGLLQEHGWTQAKVLLVALMVSAAAYSATWDVVIDWSLLSSTRKGTYGTHRATGRSSLVESVLEALPPSCEENSPVESYQKLGPDPSVPPAVSMDFAEGFPALTTSDSDGDADLEVKSTASSRTWMGSFTDKNAPGWVPREAGSAVDSAGGWVSLIRSTAGFMRWVPRVGWYVIAIVLDVVARFWWVSTIVVGPLTTPVASAVTLLVASLIEIVRRAVWIVGRMDNEHWTNRSRFRKEMDAVPRLHCVDGKAADGISRILKGRTSGAASLAANAVFHKAPIAQPDLGV